MKAKVNVRMDLWHRVLLEEFALRSKVQSHSHPTNQRSKIARAARRAARLIYKQQFARAASLADNLGVVDVTSDTLESLRHLFPAPSGVPEEDLLDHYDLAAPPNPDNPPVSVDLETLRPCLVVAPPLSYPHKDGWRVEHLVPLAVGLACGENLAAFMTMMIKDEVSDKIADLLSSATLAVLLKKDAETMA